MPKLYSFRRDVATLALLTLAAAGLAGILNASRAQPLPWRYQNREARLQAQVGTAKQTPAAAPGLILPSQLGSVPEAMMVDARTRAFYELGHLPGAISVPREHFRSAYDAAPLLQADKARPVVVYCQGGECVDSQLVAEALAKLGHRKVLVLHGGLEAWQQEVTP